MSTLCIITARGGSKRIPKKNIKNFCGKPIIAYSIEVALASEVFDEVMVSTDNEEIAEVAKRYGAKVPFLRSSETSGDYATTLDVLREVVRKYREYNKKFDYIACLYPTAPFITSEKLREGFRLIQKDGIDWVNTVVKFSFPPQRGNVIEDGYLKFRWPENYYKRSQDLEEMYHECGQFYFYKVSALLEKEEIDMVTLPIVLNEMETQDIDNETDWKLAELKYNLIYG